DFLEGDEAAEGEPAIAEVLGGNRKAREQGGGVRAAVARAVGEPECFGAIDEERGVAEGEVGLAPFELGEVPEEVDDASALGADELRELSGEGFGGELREVLSVHVPASTTGFSRALGGRQSARKRRRHRAQA